MIADLARLVLLTAMVAGGSSCGGGAKSPAPSAPTPVPTGTTPSTSLAPLPYGQAIAGSVPCPAGTGPSASATCSSLAVTCPSVPSASTTLRVTRPASTASNRGTIILTTGGDGTNFADSVLTGAMISTFVADGLTVVQMAWNPPGIWGDARARTVACRYATAAKWIYDNIHVGGRSRLFAAQGTSGGASQIGFALAHYGFGDFLDLANLGGGPTACPLCPCDGQAAVEPLLPVSLFSNVCSRPPPSTRDPLLNYPATVARFFLGDQDDNHEGTADHAKAYYGAITSSKSFTTVPNTPHVVESTQAGVDAFVAAVRGALK